MTAKQGNDPAWRYVDGYITAVEKQLGRRLTSEAVDARRVTAAVRRSLEEGAPDAGFAVDVAATEGVRRRIYERNHATSGEATWFDKQGAVFKKTGQFPLTVRAPREAPSGETVDVEVAVRDLTREQLTAWLRRREDHLAGERINLDVFRELLRLWGRFPQAQTLGGMCDEAGLDLLDLRFTA